MTNNDISQIVDLERYPLHHPGSEAAQELMQRCRNDLVETGACILPGFISSQAVEQSQAEAVDKLSQAHQVNYNFAYDDTNDDSLMAERDSLPEDHPRRYQSLTRIRFIARDLMNRDSLIRHLHQWWGMKQFLEHVMDKEEIRTFDCPLAGCIYTVAEKGELQDWHFDGNEFIVTLMLEAADQGGTFDYVPGLRKPGPIDDYETISDVLKDKYPDVTTLDIQPGTLTLFKGQYNLHRASPVTQGRRVMAILSYEQEQGKVSTDEYAKLFYGRTVAEASW